MQFFTDTDLSSSQTPPPTQSKRPTLRGPSDTAEGSDRTDQTNQKSSAPTQKQPGIFSSLWNSLTSSSQPTSVAPTTPTEWVNPQWVAVDAQSAPLLIAASLRGGPAYLKSKSLGTISPDDWTFNPLLTKATRQHLQTLASDPAYGEIIESLMDSELFNVKVANTAKRIKEELEKERWPIRFDADGAQEASAGYNTLLVASRLTINCEESDWRKNGLDMRASSNRYGGQFITITQDGERMMMSRDLYGHPVAQYPLNVKGHIVTVRMTDITRCPKQTPSMSDLLASHLSSDNFRPLEAKGVEFPSIKVTLGNKLMERLLSAKNGGWEFIAAQAAGKLQITSQKPLHLDVAAVALMVFRGSGGPSAYTDYLQFYRVEDGQLKFNLLVEVLVRQEGQPATADQVLLSCLANENDHRGSTESDGYSGY